MRVLRCSWNRGSARIATAESRGDAESAGSKNSRLLEHARRDSRGQSVRERAVSESSASTSAAFRCFGKIRLSSRRLPFVPILLGKAASARTRRLRNRAGSAMFLEPRSDADSGGESRGDAESAGSKTSACWNRYAGIAVGSLYGNGQFPKVPHLLLRRFDVLGKSDFPLVGSLSCLYYWEKPHQSARKEYAASPARVKFPDGNAQQRMRATCRVCRSGTQLFSAAHACDFKVANGLVVLYKYVPRRQRV